MAARPGPDTSDICKGVDPVDLEDEDEDVVCCFVVVVRG